MSTTQIPDAPSITRLEAMQIARRMRDTGWTCREIMAYLSKRGVEVKATETILRWTDPKYAEARRTAKRHRERDRLRRLNPAAQWRTVTDADKYHRLVKLREAGLSCADTARVLYLDFGDRLSRSQVEYAERSGRYPLSARKAAA